MFECCLVRPLCLPVCPLSSHDSSLTSGLLVMEAVVITVIISLYKYVLKNYPDKLDSDLL